ncbi:uncharacterized protein AC631_03914 [Debaryomyces fabryi]|uniref:Uncharacterized protein n=1 Tax=Debaryomyces fabryi TaxID=58627 RepID=A0A0V1PVQ5_9ASCO|nr:uncharacterized protein AC631_03914 [Debaryomyces fabryi]KSA00349.1 hypothetical protein AC631_03914 [Debaryomyces fabryi]
MTGSSSSSSQETSPGSPTIPEISLSASTNIVTPTPAASSVLPITTLITSLCSTASSASAAKLSNSVSETASPTSSTFFTGDTTIFETISSGQTVTIKTCEVAVTMNSNGEYITSTSIVAGTSALPPSELELSKVVGSQATSSEQSPSELVNTLTSGHNPIEAPSISEGKYTTVSSISLLNNIPTVAAISKQGSLSFYTISEPIPNVSSSTLSTASGMVTFSSVSPYSGAASSSKENNSLLWKVLLVFAYIV